MAKKKDFTQSNPALAFMSTEVQADAKKEAKHTKRTEPAPEGYKVNPLYIETKSKRLNLLIQPSLYAQIKEAAARAGLSVNETITEAIRDYLESEEAE